MTLLQQPLQDYLQSNGAIDPTLLTMVAESGGLSAAARLAIYRDGYRIRLRQALAAAFDKTHALIGDALFEQMCDGYIDAQPSRYDNLRWYGDLFAQHLAGALPSYAFVAELAQFEWALGLAFDAADAPLLTLDTLAGQSAESWEQISFTLQPALQFLTLEWNVVAIWLALDADAVPPAPALSTLHWLVWRHGWQPRFRSATALEFETLQALARGLGFAAVCSNAHAASADFDVTAQIAAWLQVWREETLLSAIVYKAASATPPLTGFHHAGSLRR